MEVLHNNDLERFEIHLDDEMGLVEYSVDGKHIFITHTEVPPAYEGGGIGSMLAKAVLEYAREQGFTVHPHCPFIALYIRRHPEYQPITWGYQT